MKRLIAQLLFLLILAGIAFYVVASGWRKSKELQNKNFQCSNRNFGNEVVCVGGASNGGDNAYLTTKNLTFSPTAGHAVIATAYTCADSKCQNIPTTTMTIGDNLQNPEACFQKSPGSPFSLIETSAGKQKLQDYIWICPSIPFGVTSFTITCSAANSCSYMTFTVTEWTGIATSDVFDTDGGGASSVQQSSLSISTSKPLSFTNDLIYTWFDNSADEAMTPGPPYKQVLQFFRGNLNSGTTVNTGDIQTTTASWTGNDDWYGVIAAIKTAASQPRNVSSDMSP
jgi:hypothetical protein